MNINNRHLYTWLLGTVYLASFFILGAKLGGFMGPIYAYIILGIFPLILIFEDVIKTFKKRPLSATIGAIRLIFVWPKTLYKYFFVKSKDW